MKTIHALLVDDDSQALATMGTILEMDDFVVTTATSGSQALERLEAAEETPRKVDFMVVDLDMANLSGIELLLEMHRRGHSIPVMVVTGHASRATVVELLRQGVSDFLDKPVNMEDFRHRINRLARLVLQRRREKPAQPAAPRGQAATLQDLAALGMPYAARRIVESAGGSHLVLACRKKNGFDLLFADVESAGNEGFYVSVILKSFFDRHRALEIPGREFIRSLNEALMDGCLERPGVKALYVRIRTPERRMEVFPAGFASRWYLGLGEDRSRVLDFEGSPLGLVDEARETVCELPYSCRDRLFLLGEGAEHADTLRDRVLDPEGGPLEEMVDEVWTEILADRRERRNHDLFLLGLELP